MRVVAAAAVLNQVVIALRAQGLAPSSVFALLTAGAAILLLVGLWTPVVGALAAALELRSVFSHPGDPWTSILLCTISAALALLGPGAYSVDARVFGWKRIEIRDRQG